MTEIVRISILDLPPWNLSHSKVETFEVTVSNFVFNTEALDISGLITSGLPGGSVTLYVDNPEALFHKWVYYEFVQSPGTEYTGYAFVNGVSFPEDGAVQLTLFSTVQALNYEYFFPPFVGTFQGALDAASSIAVGTETQLLNVTDLDLKNMSVNFPSYFGNGWSWISLMCQAVGAQFTYFAGALIFVEGENKDVKLDALEFTEQPQLQVSSETPAQNVEVAYYTNNYRVGKEVYPVVGEDPQVFSVDAGEQVEYTIQLDTHLITINQPQVTNWVEFDQGYYDGTNGVYSVAGNDGRPITAAQWRNTGGSLSVRLSETDATQVIVTIHGSDVDTYSPYRIAMTSGNYYSSLRITGTGVQSIRQTLLCPTGADPYTTNTVIGRTIENPCIATLERAREIGVKAAKKFSGVVPSYEVSATTPSGTETLVVSKKMKRRDNVYRLVSHSVSSGAVPGLSLELDTRMSDFQVPWIDGVDTMADFETQWPSGKTMLDFILAPLRKD